MRVIDNLTGFSRQQTVLVLPDGTAAALELRYMSATQRWVANVTYGARAINGIGVCCHPNLLRQWRNVIPFGIQCVTADQTDPVYAGDFASGRVTLNLLSAADVQQVESQLMEVARP